MNSYERALQKIQSEQEKYKLNNCCFMGSIVPGPKGEKGDMGPTGPEGKMGPTGPQGEMGPAGMMGPTGPQGIPGEIGPTGAQGNDGTSVTILGNYANFSELENTHPTGSLGQSYLVGDDLYVWSEERGTWVDVGLIRGPQGEQGVQGPTGPEGKQGEQGEPGVQGPMGERGPEGPQGIPGPLNIPTSFYLTTSEDNPGGLEIEPQDHLPIALQMRDENNIFLSTGNNTLTFLEGGTFLITFTVVAHANPSNILPNSNVISVGLKKLTESTVYAGCSVVADTNTSSILVGYGVIDVSPTDWFALYNVGSSSFILDSPLNDESSMTSPTVSILIQKLK